MSELSLQPPVTSDEELAECRKNNNFIPLLFEWYKFVSGLGITVANIQPDSPAYKKVSPQHYHVLVGLLNRCARLMFSNVVLSHQGKLGETTAIVDRCIFESSVKLRWLCDTPTDEKFNTFLADGLKTELEFKAWITATIKKNGATLPIEQRMLRSIDRHIQASGLSEEQIAASPKLLDFASMLTKVGFDRLMYITAHRIGSHHIHGTWPSLLLHYLEEPKEPIAGYRFNPRGNDCDMHLDQYMFISVMMLETMAHFVKTVLEDDVAQAFLNVFESTDKTIMKFYTEAIGEDAKKEVCASGIDGDWP